MIKELFNKQNESQVYFNYFERICDVSTTMIFKANIPRSEKINLQLQIKKITFNYKEDLEEKLEVSFSSYLNRFKDFIKDWLKNEERENI